MNDHPSWPEAVRLAAGVRLAGAIEEPAGGAAMATSGRLIRYAFSDASVGRDNHVIAPDAWDLTNFKRNPVFLWAHDADQPPIGRVVEIGTVGGKLRGAVEYAERDVYPFADTIFQLTKAGYINATSTGWLPLEWQASRDRSRPGGVDFSRVELLEISQVPVPALPTALVEARARGIDTGPLHEWAERMLDTNGFAVIARAELELLRKESRMPLPAKTSAAPIADDTSQQRNRDASAKPKKRSLYHCGWLASLLADVAYLLGCVEVEAACESDGSPVPGDLAAAAKALGKVLVEMTVEEVSEAFADDDGEAPVVVDEPYLMAAGVPAKRQAFRLLRGLDDFQLAQVSMAMDGVLRGEKIAFSRNGKPLARAGKVLSAESERCMRAVHNHISQARDLVGGLLEKTDDGAPDGDGDADGDSANSDNDDDAQRALALRKRKASALKAKLELQAAE